MRCPECGSNNIFTDSKRGEKVCLDCGFVIDSCEIDHGPEWFRYDPETVQRKCRVGSPTTYTLHDKGLQTVIKGNRDVNGHYVDARNLFRAKRKVTVLSKREKRLASLLHEVERIVSMAGLGKSVKVHACYLCHKACDVLTNKNYEAAAAAIVYLACKTMDVPVTIDEILKCTFAERKLVTKYYKILQKELNLRTPPTNPEKYLHKIVYSLKVKDKMEIIRMAEGLLRKVDGNIGGKKPIGVAAAAVYIVGRGKGVTQKDVAYAAGVTEVTVRNTYKEIMKLIGD